MKTKLHVVFILLLFHSFMPDAFATDFYTKSTSATLAGNTGALNTNWTTNPDGITGLTNVDIAATDNLIILNGGTVTITAGMTINALTINSGGTIIHANNGIGNSFTINGLLVWNGTIKTLQGTTSNFFSANGNISGTTAIHDVSSNRGIYCGGDGLRTISLIQTAGVVNSAFSGLLLTKNHTLVGNCKLYDALNFNQNAILDLAGYNLEVSSIQGAVATTRVVKGNAASILTLGGTMASTIFFELSAKVLNSLSINNQLWPGASAVTIGTDLTVNSLLDFGVSSVSSTRILQVNGNFTLADNGTLHIRAGGPTAGTTYDQLLATGNINIGAATTIKVDFVNSYSPTSKPFLDFLKTTSPSTVIGTFGTIQSTNGYNGNVTYTANTLQYQVLSAPPLPPPPPPCPVTLTPDLPLVPSNATVETEINTIIQRYSDSYLGTVEPTATVLNAAIASYNALNISVDGYTITAGTAVTNYTQVTSFLKTFAQYLKFHPEDTNNIYTKALNTIWLVSDRVCKGNLAIDYNQNDFRNFGQSAVLIQGIKNNPHVKGLFVNLLYQQNIFDYLWEPNKLRTDIGYNIDHIGNSGVVTMAYVKWLDSADERYRYMTAFKRQVEKFMSYSDGTTDGIKPDGSTFHHWAAYPGYTYNLNSEATIVYLLRQTSFQVNAESYLRLRDAIMAQLMLANDMNTRSLLMSGRNPQITTANIGQYQFRDMAVTGGSILNTGASDPVMATYYNRVWGSYAPFENNAKASFNEGYFQFNHSAAGIYRKDNWVVTYKGFDKSMFGAEIYLNANRFGRYQSYGGVSIVYDGDASTGNGYDHTTWNWNYNPGTTVIKLPWDKLHGEKENLDELQQKSFAGSLSFINKNNGYLKTIQGTYGMFAMDFQEKTGQGFGIVYGPESHNNTFTFKKSVFTFDNMLICLGSGIGNNDVTNATVTTLYQRKAFAGKDQVTIDNNLLSTASYDNSFDDTANHWILDNYGTGFYVFAGSGIIKLTKADQQTPQHNQLWSAQNIANNPIGNYAIGYIDHGTAPSNKQYEYICMPKTTGTDMTILGSQIDAGNKPYTVHRKDDIAHIVEYKPTAATNSIFGYAFFSALSEINNSGQLTGADYPCMVMSQYDSAQKSLKLALTNPDLGFAYRMPNPSVNRQVNITVKGTNWQISQPNANASITGTANGETTIKFTIVDGLPVEITLSRILTPQTITFDALPTKNATDAAFDLTATASSNLPVSYISSNTTVATVSGNTVTIVGKGSTTITASQEGNTIYDVATAVIQILRVNTEPTVSITSSLANASYNAPATISITADANDVDGSVSKVEFFQGTNKLGESIVAPYSLDWVDIAAGSYSITAKATDSDGAVTTSELVNVIINALPTVSIISPSANAIYDAPATFKITTDAFDTDGSVAKVEFFQGQTKLGQTTEAPYSFDWINAPAGSYALTAKITDNKDAVTTSEIVNITVNALPTVTTLSPTNNSSYNALASILITADATDSDGTVSKVEFFNGTTKLGEDFAAPYSFNWSNVTSGAYSVTTKVTDNLGAVTTSKTVNIRIVCPAVQVTIPDVYVINSSINKKNMLYLGYGPSSITLNAFAHGDQDFTYNWNTGANTRSITVSQAGTYTVNVSYGGGCQATASIEIDVLDVRCGNDNSKVQICHKNNTICVSQSAVQSHLNHGDQLGSCGGTLNMIKREEVNSSGCIVYPNPIKDSLNVSLSSTLDSNATISIYNIIGKKIRQVRFTTTPQNVFVGDLPSGNYIVIVSNGLETFKSKIVKL